MPKARRSSSRRRARLFEKKYQHRTVPLRYKTLLPSMEAALKTELPIFVDLEQPIIEECQSKGVPSEKWQYYIGFGKRAKSITQDFTYETKEAELSTLVDEYVKRGLDQQVLTQILGIAAPWILGTSKLGVDTRLG